MKTEYTAMRQNCTLETTFIKALAFALAMAVVSCRYNDKPVAYAEDVELDMQIEQFSTGFAQVSVEASKEAYYYITCQEVRPESYSTLLSLGGEDMLIDVKLSSKMQKGLITELLTAEKDQYNHWRDSVLQTTEHVADFASYILHYTVGDHYFYNLKPNTLYWLYSFPINPETFNPVGDLFVKTFRTCTESKYSHIRFNYRVKGYWDYCYPVDPTTGMIASNVPWIGYTACLDDIDTELYKTPAQYFDHIYNNVGSDAKIRRGIYTRCNDGKDDGTSKTLFLPGKTYYTGIYVYDGERCETAFDIYRFVWKGENTELFLTDAESNSTSW